MQAPQNAGPTQGIFSILGVKTDEYKNDFGNKTQAPRNTGPSQCRPPKMQATHKGFLVFWEPKQMNIKTISVTKHKPLTMQAPQNAGHTQGIFSILGAKTDEYKNNFGNKTQAFHNAGPSKCTPHTRDF